MGKERVVVAMSGGVDSSLAAALLLAQGYDVVGVTMRLSNENRDVDPENDRSCCSLSSVDDARRVADVLGIRHYVMDFTMPFQTSVIDYFLDEYLLGRTPNPCIACNRYIKFEGLLHKSAELGASHVATGHYARIDFDGGMYRLRKGKDVDKDQSYVLYHLNQETLAHVLLPLGDFDKGTTRRMAEEYRLPVAHKPESQEICFVPRDDYKSYMKEKRPGRSVPGDIVDRAGNVLGHHDGISFYTIGQRRGLGIAAPQPLYVTALDAVHNHVVVGTAEEVFARELTASDLSWTMWESLDEVCMAHAKIRYGKREAEARIMPLDGNRLRVRFTEPQRAVTPGQSIVFYEGDVVLGGGVIDAVLA
ncbi:MULTISPECIES: tRNA 2-thiouridine(34) synthase MnmA [unclassified Selenomonas]|uniref:tRNA 2-thiouridine(34) synthase MnmA n=1 Tax=unclassified Selenomonas TaxID=2637378 RepID=UPI0015845C5B|nr:MULTISPECIES: tRNA 2-thiouridine(34) synthase MnmA [unclassified Selenomonas]